MISDYFSNKITVVVFPVDERKPFEKELQMSGKFFIISFKCVREPKFS
jgi:hypothetical protein